MHHATHQVSDESISEMLKAAAVVPTNQDSCISEEDYQGIFAKQGLRTADEAAAAGIGLELERTAASRHRESPRTPLPGLRGTP